MRHALTTLAVGISLLAATQALAQQNPSAEADYSASSGAAEPQTAAGVGIAGDIVVTARRRAENLQDVPISVTALSGGKLAESGVIDIYSLQTKVPSLNIQAQGTNRNEASFAIRGQRTNESQLLTDAPVGTYFMEVVQARSIGFANTLYDLESVQVLKGVQGTLFGRNMTGGAVLVEPSKPTDTLGAEIVGQIGNYKLRDLYGMINVPVAEGVALRVAGKTRQHDGYATNILDGRDYDDENYDTFRVSLRLAPTSNIESNTVFDWNRSHRHGDALIPTAINPLSPGIAAYATFRGFGIPVSNPVAEFAAQQNRSIRQFASNLGLCGVCASDAYSVKPYERLKNWGITNRTTIDLGSVTLKNVAGYRKVSFNQLSDLDGAPTVLISSNRYRYIKQYSEELQAAGTAFNESLDYVAGLYYFQEKGVDGATSSQFPELAIANPANGFPANTPQSVLATRLSGDGKAETGAAYVAGTYAVSDQFKISAGARYTKDKRTAGVITQNENLVVNGVRGRCNFKIDDGNGNITSPSFANCRQTNAKSWNAFTWDLTLQYEPNPDLTTYIATRKGFRAGGFSLRATSTREFEAFDPEMVQEYELGLKKRFRLGGASLSTNVALFYQDYKNIQKQTIGTDSQGNVVTLIENTAAQENYGGEFELALSAGDFDLSAFYSYVAINIKEGRSPGEFELVGTPHHQLGANATYRMPLSGDLGQLAINVNGSYRTKTFMDKNDVPGIEPGYALLHARLSWDKIAGTGFGAAAFVKNITNKVYRVGAISIYNEAGYTSGLYGDPRTYGFELSYKF